MGEGMVPLPFPFPFPHPNSSKQTGPVYNFQLALLSLSLSLSHTHTLMELQTSYVSVALIVGVTGMVGCSLAEALKQPNCLGGPWRVIGVARRHKPSWFPSSIVDHFITFDALNSHDTGAKLFPFSHEITHLFWLTFQAREDEEDNVKINETMLSNVLSVLKSTPSSRLSHVTIQTGTKHYMGPIFDPSRSHGLISHDPPFHEYLPRLPYPNFYYALEDLIASHTPSLTYSVHRSSIIIGASTRSVYNALLTLAVYATICRHQGLQFRFPGNSYTWEHFCDMTDAGVLAQQHMWAAATEKAKNQAFNCTNGDVFMWKAMWKLLCELFNLEFVPFSEGQEFDWDDMMSRKGAVWDEIVEKYGLYQTKLEEITCCKAFMSVLNFKFQHVSSMNKSKEYGFFGHVDTFKSIRMWVAKLKQMKIIPQIEN